MLTDPIADMLTRIRNGCRARLERVDVPASNLKKGIAEILKAEGYVEDYRFVSDQHQGVLEVKLRYGRDGNPIIKEIKRISRPGLRRYAGRDDIPKVRNGLGVMIMTTSKGLMTDREARRTGIGGEALCSVW